MWDSLRGRCSVVKHDGTYDIELGDGCMFKTHIVEKPFTLPLKYCDTTKTDIAVRRKQVSLSYFPYVVNAYG